MAADVSKQLERAKKYLEKHRIEDAIEAYLVLTEGAELPAVERQITTRLAPYKRPRRLHVVEQLPRTATGKLVRSHAALRERQTTP